MKEKLGYKSIEFYALRVRQDDQYHFRVEICCIDKILYNLAHHEVGQLNACGYGNRFNIPQIRARLSSINLEIMAGFSSCTVLRGPEIGRCQT